MTNTLTTIPTEIRQSIFREIFASTTVYIGFDDPEDQTSSAEETASHETCSQSKSNPEDGMFSISESSSSQATTSPEKSSETNTSILRACRLINTEATPILAAYITLTIWSTKAMIDFFSTLRPEIIRSLRYLRLQESFPIPPYTQLHRNHFTTFHVNEAFCMFPGLQLDRLTVEDCYHVAGCYCPGGADPSNIGTYQTIDGLIQINGWKELHFITPTTQFISEPSDPYHQRVDSHLRPVAQPSYWNSLALDRDGKNSGASVIMFVGMKPDIEGITEDPKTRLGYEATVGQNMHLEGYGNESPAEQHRLRESREVLVVAKRGVGASYVQNGSELHKDVKSLLSRMTWQEVLVAGLYLNPENDPALML